MATVGQPLACIQVAPNSGWRSYGDDMLVLPMSPLDFTLTSFDENASGCEIAPDQDYGTYQISNNNTGTFSTPLADQENDGQADVSRLETPASLPSFDVTMDDAQEQPETGKASNESEHSFNSNTAICSDIFSAGLVNIDEVSRAYKIFQERCAHLVRPESGSAEFGTQQILDLDKDNHTEREMSVVSKETERFLEMRETVYSAASSFGLKELLIQASLKSKESQMTRFIQELEEVFGQSNMSPPDSYCEQPRISLEDDFQKRKWCNGE